MTASLQGVLDGSTEADDLSGELAPDPSNSDGSSASRAASETEDAASNAPTRHPWALTRGSPGMGSSVYRMQTELFTTTMARIKEGFVRECPAERAARHDSATKSLPPSRGHQPSSRDAGAAPKTAKLVGNPTPYTLNPDTLHPTPYTLHPTPYTLNPKPQTLNPRS